MLVLLVLYNVVPAEMASSGFQAILPPIVNKSRIITQVLTQKSAVTSEFIGRKFHSNAWNFIQRNLGWRKYDSDSRKSDVVKDIKEKDSSKKAGTNYPRRNSFQYPKITIHEQFGGVKSNGGFDFPPASTTRVTISNKARDYNELIRREKSLNIIQNAEKITGNTVETADVSTNKKDHTTVKAGSKVATVKTNERSVLLSSNHLVSTSSDYEDEVSSRKKVLNSPSPIPTSPSNELNHINYQQNDATLSEKDKYYEELEKAILAVRSERKNKEGITVEDTANDVFSRRKVSSKISGEKESLFQKYSVKKPGALYTDELVANIDKSTGKKLKYTLNVRQKSKNPRSSPITLSLSGNDSKDNSEKGVKKFASVKMKHKSRKHRNDSAKRNQEKCDDILAKLGLITDENLRSKINGDLYMNILEVLEKNNHIKGEISSDTAQKSKQNDATREDTLKTILSAGEEGSDDTDRDKRPERKRVSKKRKQDKSSNIDRFWGVGRRKQYPGDTKWKIVSRKPYRKLKQRKVKLRKRKSKVLRTRRTTYNLKSKQDRKPAKKPEECGDISQNE